MTFRTFPTLLGFGCREVSNIRPIGTMMCRSIMDKDTTTNTSKTILHKAHNLISAYFD